MRIRQYKRSESHSEHFVLNYPKILMVGRSRECPVSIFTTVVFFGAFNVVIVGKIGPIVSLLQFYLIWKSSPNIGPKCAKQRITPPFWCTIFCNRPICRRKALCLTVHRFICIYYFKYLIYQLNNNGEGNRSANSGERGPQPRQR